MKLLTSNSTKVHIISTTIRSPGTSHPELSFAPIARNPDRVSVGKLAIVHASGVGADLGLSGANRSAGVSVVGWNHDVTLAAEVVDGFDNVLVFPVALDAIGLPLGFALSGG